MYGMFFMCFAFGSYFRVWFSYRKKIKNLKNLKTSPKKPRFPSPALQTFPSSIGWENGTDGMDNKVRKGERKRAGKEYANGGQNPPLPPSKLNLAHAHERINVFSSAATSIFTSLHVQIRI